MLNNIIDTFSKVQTSLSDGHEETLTIKSLKYAYREKMQNEIVGK